MLKKEEGIFHGTFYGDTMYFVVSDPENKHVYKEYDLYNYISNPWGTFHPKVKYVKSEEEIPKEPISPRLQEVYDNLKAYCHAYYDSIMVHNELPKIIPPEILGRKVISVRIGGGGGFADRIFEFYLCCDIDEALFIKLLEERTDDEIASYYYAVYVGSYVLSTEYQQENYDILSIEYQENYECTKLLSPRLAAQMKRAYERVLHDLACCCEH